MSGRGVAGSETAGWLSLGLGVIEYLSAAMATGGNGVAVQADAISYHVSDTHPAQGHEETFPVVNVDVQGAASISPLLPASAVINMTGLFAYGAENPPVIANARMWCGAQDGAWGTSGAESELLFNAQAMPSPVGTADDPHLQWQSRLELKIPNYTNVVVHFVVDVNSLALCQFSDIAFEYGECQAYPAAGYLQVTYAPN